MREALARLKLIKATAAALNRLPVTRARGASVYEVAFTDEPDVIVSTRGRIVVLVVTLPLVTPSTDKLERLDLWRSQSNARCAVVDSVAGALAIVAEVADDAAFVDEALGELVQEAQY